MDRKITKQVRVGSVLVGGGAPISIQSMLNTDTRDSEASYRQTMELYEAGCQIVRLAIPDMEAVKGFGELKKKAPVPLVADIHFDYRLALAVMDEGADKIRINPGNIGSEDRVRAVLEKAKSCRIPIRIGVNSGSLEKGLIEKYGGVTAEALAESAINALKFAEGFGFEDIVLSLKSADVQMNHQAHRILSSMTDRPLHIGLTEPGFGRTGEMKSTAALSALLLDGIGDTMRISLTDSPIREVILAKEILEACGIRKSGIDFISCPTCGRTRVDLPGIASKIKEALQEKSMELAGQNRFIKLAVMGCEVNGPGEAKNADYGVACGKGTGLLISHGQPVKTVPEDRIIPELIAMIEKI